MHYDPIKVLLGHVFNRHRLLRRFFYFLLDILLLRSWHVRKALRKASSQLPSAANVLDAGMGFGQYSWWMAKRFTRWNITAIDIKSEQVADCSSFFLKTKVANRVRVAEADLVTMPVKEKFDLILCVDVMEHIEEDRKVLSNFAASLNSGGKLVISTPSDKGGSDVHGENEESFIGEHVRDGYSVEDIKLKLTESGFNDVTASYTYGLAGSIAWKLSMKYPVTLLTASKMFFIVIPFYYIVVMPVCLVLNLIDLHTEHNEGTGLLVIAEINS